MLNISTRNPYPRRSELAADWLERLSSLSVATARPTWILAASLGACAPKEAQDPSEIIAEDPSFLGEDPGAFESTEGPGPEPRSGESATPGPAATYAQCAAAARRIEELGLELAIEQEPDPDRRKALSDQKATVLESRDVKRRVERSAGDCVAHRRSRVETECIASAESEESVEACLSGE